METNSVKKVQNIFLPNGQEFEVLLTKLLAKVGNVAKELRIDDSLIQKIRNEYTIYVWLADYQDWLKTQILEVNMLKRNIRHLPKYEDMSNIQKISLPIPVMPKHYKPEGNLNKLVLELIRKVVSSDNYTNELGTALGIDHVYWHRVTDVPA